MKFLRSVLFWTHLTAGVLASVVILVMSFTGVVLALKPQIQDWVERDVRYVTPPASPRLGAQQILAAVTAAMPEASLQSLALARDPAAAAAVNIGRDANLYVDPYTGVVLGSGSAPVARFFQTMTSWHRYMGASGEQRPIGKSATGVSNLAFLLLGVTGLYIWWPRQLTLQHLRPIVWFRRSPTGRARDFNWHNTIGFWCVIPIVIMTLSGAVISYTWATNLVYRITGSPVPAARGGAPGVPAREIANGAPASRGSAGRGRSSEGPAREGAARSRGAADGANRGAERNQPEVPIIPAELDRIWTRAERQVPTWSLLSMRLPTREGGPVAFTITDGAHWNPFARSNLTLHGASAEVIQWQPYADGSRGQILRGWLRFAHTGELGGLPGQIVAGIGCLGGLFLVCTGLSLAFRRLWNWSLWKRLAADASVPAQAGASLLAQESAVRRETSTG
jgi:uncharacterized iron-regulated membrane protein